MSDAQFLPRLPPQMPQLPPSFMGHAARWVLRCWGWRIAGELPDLPKVVLIAAPHSSNWDAVLGLLFKVALRAEIHFIGKREAFFWPIGVALRSMGGIPIDRNAAHDLVAQMRERFAANERFWLGLAPEGTRRKVTKWKSGFWHIARAADVPILPMYFHYPEKVIGFGPTFATSSEFSADMVRLREFYAPFKGKNRGTLQ